MCDLFMALVTTMSCDGRGAGIEAGARKAAKTSMGS